ncbi:MAG: hypothetical protein ACREJB_11420 [Planctomycetaceae bacterium]
MAFHRKAADLAEAVRTAVRDVRKAGFQVRHVQIEGEALEELINTPAETHS